MKQIVQDFKTGDLKVDEIPPPALRPGGILVRTAYSLISAGTERATVMAAQSSLVGKILRRPDLVRQGFETLRREGFRSTYEKARSRLGQVKALGYSASGFVIAVGEGAPEFQVGDPVACGGVGYASHAEVIFVPRNLCVRVPEGVSLESACYATVGAVALHGIHQGEVRLGETAAVIGLGLIGQLAVQILKAAGCGVIGVDIDPLACELARKCGADVVCANAGSAPSECRQLTEGRGADCVLITAGTRSNDPIELAAELARDRARVVAVGLIGLDIPRDVFYAKELDLRLSRSYGPGRYDPEYEERGIDYPVGYVRWTERRNMEAFLRLVAEGKLKTAILTTHCFPIEQAKQAYDLIVAGGRSVGRVQHPPGYRCGVVLEYPREDHAIAPVIKIASRKPVAADKLRVSFVGAGNFGRGVLLPILHRSADLHLAGIATATGISAKSTAEQFGFSYLTTDYSQVLNDDGTDCVFIATRHDLHARIAAEALKNGKAVFVEKPLAIDETGLREVLVAAADCKRSLMVGYNRRFAPLAACIKSRLQDRSGALTVIYRVNAGQLPADHWSLDEGEGGGRIIGEVCHFVDFIQYLTDSLPVRVFAAAARTRQAAGFVDDGVSVSINMSDGSIASIVYAASGDSSVPKERVEAFCDRSVAIIDDFRTGEFIHRGKRTRLGGPRQDKGHAAEVAAFLEAVREGADEPISVRSLVATSLTTFAILESIRSGASVPVDLKEWFG